LPPNALDGDSEHSGVAPQIADYLDMTQPGADSSGLPL